MGGPSQQTVSNQQGLVTAETNLANYLMSQGQQDTAQRNALIAPATSFYSSIASGSPKTAMAAAAPLITNINQGTEATKEAIYDATSPGAARDALLAENARSGSTNVASALNSTYLNSFGQLANIGSGFGSFAMGETGQAGSGFGTAGNINQSVAQMQEASSPWSFLGQLAGAGGEAAGGLLGNAGLFAGKAAAAA